MLFHSTLPLTASLNAAPTAQAGTKPSSAADDLAGPCPSADCGRESAPAPQESFERCLAAATQRPQRGSRPRAEIDTPASHEPTEPPREAPPDPTDEDAALVVALSVATWTMPPGRVEPA